MLIVDSQIHVWRVSSPERPWPQDGGPSHELRQYLPSDALAEMDTAGVDTAVLVPPSFEGDYNDVVLEATATHPDRFLAMGRLDIADVRNAALLDRWTAAPGMRGIRLTFVRPRFAEWLNLEVTGWFWAKVERLDIPLMMYAPGREQWLSDLAARHPRLHIILDHMNLPTTARGRTEVHAALEPVLELARRSNMAIKLSSVPRFASDGYPFQSVHDGVRALVDSFGPARCFWGSDLTQLSCPYTQVVTCFTEEMPFLNGPELELVMGRALVAWLTPAGEVGDDDPPREAPVTAQVERQTSDD